jgi:NAD(P)H-dependent flavin oxidoreductase YrpB (nitropropane dioxygenase family)
MKSMDRNAVVEALDKAVEILEDCRARGADGITVGTLLKILVDASIRLESESDAVQADDRTVAEVSRVLRKPEWVVRTDFDEAVQAVCARVLH